MKKKFSLFQKLYFTLILVCCFSIASNASTSDWPIYKGNIYFTGNNDEIIVKNNNLKWLFQADDRAFNPIVSDGRVYFIDKRANLYCLDEEYGSLIWKINMRNISRQFKKLSRAAGKIKYPLIIGNTLLLSDPVAIYALNKISGRVLWARTGMRIEKVKPQGLTGHKPLPMIDGIYSDPMIRENKIFYGTRNMFMAREIFNGHQQWENRQIKSYSGFPTFYDDKIFSQSMNYQTGQYFVHCLNLDNGSELWKKRVIRPMKIFPPVVYKRNVYITSSSSLYCLNLKDGETKWIKDYKRLITSNPGFTDRAIIFTVDNSNLIAVDPANGNILHEIKVGPRTGPKYVMIRDQAYIAYNDYKNKKRPFGLVKAVNFTNNTKMWDYKTPFPGAISQPIASNGILFLPAGNYLYAIGAEHYPQIVKGGTAYSKTAKSNVKKGDSKPQPAYNKNNPRKDRQKIKTRKMQIEVTNKNKREIPAAIDIKKRKNGKLIYSRRKYLSKSGKVEVPVGDNVEVTVSSKGYLPKKVIVNNKDKKKKIQLDKIEKGESYVIDNILFEFNKAYLKKESRDLLNGLLHIMQRDPSLKIEIRGHTDSVGNDNYNRKLSERRADAVAEYLIKNGISPERLNSVGFGESKPIADNKTKEGRKKNRRTEFYFPK